MFLPAAHAGFWHLLSMPEPVRLKWWHASADEATVLASMLREGEGIHLWLQLSEVREPRAYLLPWSREFAEQLQAAQREAEQNDTQLQMRPPFEPSLDDQKPRFYAIPQPAPPPKDQNLESPKLYERAQRGSHHEI